MFVLNLNFYAPRMQCNAMRCNEILLKSGSKINIRIFAESGNERGSKCEFARGRKRERFCANSAEVKTTQYVQHSTYWFYLRYMRDMLESARMLRKVKF